MPAKKEVRSLARELRIVTDSAGKRTLTGYAVVYNSRSVNLGGFTEIVSPSAFTRTLRESPDVYALYAHQAPCVIGRTKSGTLSLASDDHGLAFTCSPPDTAAARDMMTLIERGDIDGCSFGFMTRDDDWEEDSATGAVTRTLLDVDLDEISITPFPAYPATSVNLRSAPRELRARLSRDSDSGSDSDDDGDCDCTCGPCMDGDCGGCTDPDCDSPACACAEGRAVRFSANTREHMRMQLALAEARAR